MRFTAPIFLSIVLVLFGSPRARGENFSFEADLDPFISLPGAYGLTPDDIEKRFEKGALSRNPYFEWLTQDRSRAIFKRKPASNVDVDLTLLGGTVPIEEMIVDFTDGVFLGVTISIYNRGDSGTIGEGEKSISTEDFMARRNALGRHLGDQLLARPLERQGNINRGILTSGFTWISARGMAVIEYNPSAPNPTEFLRMRLCRRDAEGSYAAAMQERAQATVRQSELPAFVRKTPKGDVYVSNIPMVDQGAKGYCVVASVQRLFEYYGVPCDMHQLAQIAGSDPSEGTSSVKTNRELGAIDHLFKMRYTCLAIKHQGRLLEPREEEGRLYITDDYWEMRDFKKAVQKYTDAGIPLLWSLTLGPEFEEDPPLSEQTEGGHMRLIIGYNTNRDRILFSDSWGAGHELKSMSFEHAYAASSAVFLMKPVTN